jgi:hypothetical protein
MEGRVPQSPRSRLRGPSPTRIGALATAVVLALAGPLVAPPLAQASLAGSTFDGGDGNLTVDTQGGTDWANVGDVHTGVDPPSGSSFGGGTVEDDPTASVVTGPVPPDKDDLSRFYVDSELGSNQHTYLYLGWERPVGLGSADVDFEISQNPSTGLASSSTGHVTLDRTAGDLLVTYDFSGGGAPTLGLDTWLTAAGGGSVSQSVSANTLPCWGRHVDLGPVSEAAVNSVHVTDPLQAGSPSLGVGQFGEAAVDLTAAGVFTPGACQTFSSAFVKSRSSGSFAAPVTDFIAPTHADVSNCGAITIHNRTQNGDGTFGYSTIGSLSPTSFSLSGGQSRAYTGVPSGSYVVHENLPAGQRANGWTLADLTCATSGRDTIATPSSATVVITLGAGGNVYCTYTNHIKLHPGIRASLSPPATHVGGSARDGATLTGATSGAGGTVAYTAYTDDRCTQGARDAGTVTVVDANVPDSDSLAFNSAGSFYWRAVYSGDANNTEATSRCTDGRLRVDKLQPGVSGRQHVVPNDSFTLSGTTGGAGGTITFRLFDPTHASCSGTPVFTETVDVNGDGTYSTANTKTRAGTPGSWRWESTYSGDRNNHPVTSTCGAERFTIANH